MQEIVKCRIKSQFLRNAARHNRQKPLQTGGVTRAMSCLSMTVTLLQLFSHLISIAHEEERVNIIFILEIMHWVITKTSDLLQSHSKHQSGELATSSTYVSCLLVHFFPLNYTITYAFLMLCFSSSHMHRDCLRILLTYKFWFSMSEAVPEILYF